jgi:hypothetical protein
MFGGGTRGATRGYTRWAVSCMQYLQNSGGVRLHSQSQVAGDVQRGPSPGSALFVAVDAAAGWRKRECRCWEWHQRRKWGYRR